MKKRKIKKEDMQAVSNEGGGRGGRGRGGGESCEKEGGRFLAPGKGPQVPEVGSRSPL